MHTLIAKLKESQAKGKAYLNSSLVIVDEVGYLPVSSQEAYLFFQFISYSYEKSSTIITSNKSFIDWQELFGDPVIASAILDRLLHHSRVINIKGHSYRLRRSTVVGTFWPLDWRKSLKSRGRASGKLKKL
jgi:DNA replication protein DnaC